MKIILITFSTLLLVTACTTPDHNYLPTSKNISEPAAGITSTAYIGDALLRQGKYTEHDAIYLPHKADIGNSYDLSQGYYLKSGEDNTSETYLPRGGDDSGTITKIFIADPWQAVMTKKGTQSLCVITTLNLYVCNNNANFERRKKPILSSDSFQQTLIYSGKIGNKINIGYREFSNNYARPAFNNDVEYDLSESKIIGYKGAQIEVIEATNQYIKYRVIKNFYRSN